MSNQIEWTERARKGLARIANLSMRAKVYSAISELHHWPCCVLDIKKLQNRSDYRLRVGNYRVIFDIDTEGNPIITINRVEKRNDNTY